MSPAQKRNRVLLNLIYLLLLIFALLKVKEKGDFIGYVNAGNLVLNQNDIYSDVLNTWPPAFSIISIPLAIVHNFSFIFVRVLWMGIIFFCFFFSIKSCLEVLNKKRYTNKELLTAVLVSPYYLLALFLSCRSFMDNIMYLQINVVMLAACCYYIQHIDDRKTGLSSVLLGLSIGAKVYNILLLPVAILFRKWSRIIYVLLGIGLTFVLCLLIFGVQQTIDYYKHWYTEIASVKQSIVHRNQSLIAGLIRMFSKENLEVNNTAPIIDLPYSTINYIQLFIIGFLSATYLFLFSGLLKSANRDFVFHSFLLVLTMIPVLTPVSWKANYIFTLPAFFFICHTIKNKISTIAVVALFILSIVALCLSNETFIGRPAMYFLENYNVPIIGGILLFFTVLTQIKVLKNKAFYV